jgi:hypothetical protein
VATAAEVRKIARNEIGYRESGVNHTKYADQVPALRWAQNQPWCHTWISWLFLKANDPGIAPVTASCLAGVRWFKDRNQWHTTPKVGDIVYFGPGGGTHVELVVGVSSTHITTVGGNTSGSLDGEYFNGDGVYEKDVARNSGRIYGYGRPRYDTDADKTSVTPSKPSTGAKVPAFPGNLRKGSTGSPVRVFQARMKARGWRLSVDGIYGSDTERIVEQFQREKGLADDGVVGRKTWRAAWLAEVTP